MCVRTIVTLTNHNLPGILFILASRWSTLMRSTGMFKVVVVRLADDRRQIGGFFRIRSNMNAHNHYLRMAKLKQSHIMFIIPTAF